MKSSCTFNLKVGKFTELDQFIKRLDDLSYTINDDIKGMAASDARYLAEKLAENYKASMVGSGAKSDAKEVSSTPQVKLKKNRAGEWTGAPEITVNETKTGFTVKMSGKDILYQEFGTGLIGEGSYEGTLPSYWRYASGKKILQNGAYKNLSSIKEEIPEWYIKGLKEGWIKENAAVWYSPMGVTEGIPAGNFMYNTYMDFLDDFETGGHNLQLGRRNLQVYIKNKLGN